LADRDPEDSTLKLTKDHFLTEATVVECPPLSITILTGG